MCLVACLSSVYLDEFSHSLTFCWFRWLQIIRSVGQWSAGTSQTEESIHNAYISLIEKADYFIYIEVGIFRLAMLLL